MAGSRRCGVQGGARRAGYGTGEESGEIRNKAEGGGREGTGLLFWSREDVRMGGGGEV